jgi:hypothetical protein
MSNNNYFLFHSNYCEYSKKLVVALRKTEYYDKFVKICVDDRSYKIPSSITHVPAIIIPEYDQPLFNSDAIAWLDSKKSKENNDDTIEPYYPTAMSGFSDSYSDLTNETPMSHSFDFLDNEFKINAPSESSNGGGDPRKSNGSNQKKDEFEMNFEKLKQQRDLEIQKERRRT